MVYLIHEALAFLRVKHTYNDFDHTPGCIYTDYILAAVNLATFVWCTARKLPRATRYSIWREHAVTSLLLTSLFAILGGSVHHFYQSQSSVQLWSSMWIFANLVGLYGQLLIVVSSIEVLTLGNFSSDRRRACKASCFRRRVAQRLVLAAHALAFILLVCFPDGLFHIALLYTLLAMLCSCITATRIYYSRRALFSTDAKIRVVSRLFGQTLLGTAGCLAAAILQISNVSLNAYYLNHNALYHILNCIFCPSLYAAYIELIGMVRM